MKSISSRLRSQWAYPFGRIHYSVRSFLSISTWKHISRVNYCEAKKPQLARTLKSRIVTMGSLIHALFEFVKEFPSFRFLRKEKFCLSVRLRLGRSQWTRARKEISMVGPQSAAVKIISGASRPQFRRMRGIRAGGRTFIRKSRFKTY